MEQVKISGDGFTSSQDELFDEHLDELNLYSNLNHKFQVGFQVFVFVIN